MNQSYEDFKAGVWEALKNKVAERIETEREYISNSLLRGEMAQSQTPESQSNADGN